MSLHGNPERLYNGQSIAAADIPVLGAEAWRRAVLDEVQAGARLVALVGRPAAASAARLRLLAVLGRDEAGTLSVHATEVEKSYPALTPDCPQAQAFEREVCEQWLVHPEGHPWLKPVRFSPPYAPVGPSAAAPAPPPQIGVTNFFQASGEEVHEVAVGPVHAGIIEPGHFRFQCSGEQVLHLEISLGYQHRGIERALVGGPSKRSIHYIETAAGDTTVGHASAYCQVLEALASRRVPPRGAAVRAIALELERLANHTGDLGALANDVGFLPTASYCGRIRGDFLNMTALLCGNRFGRGLVRPGGCAFDVDAGRLTELRTRLDTAAKDVAGAVKLLWNTPSVMSRFEGTGVVTAADSLSLGLVGPAARAAGIDRDVRRDYPSGIFRYAHVPVSTLETGDVFARAFVRCLEIQRSVEFIRDQLHSLPGEAVATPMGELAPERVAVALVEGWRGEICHVAETDEDGRFLTYKVVDPSFHNWFGLAQALRGQKISDFPLCNKSFNLSYCGHDL